MAGMCSRHLLFPEYDTEGVLCCTLFCANLTVFFEPACVVKNKFQSCPMGIYSLCFKRRLNAQVDMCLQVGIFYMH